MIIQIDIVIIVVVLNNMLFFFHIPFLDVFFPLMTCWGWRGKMSPSKEWTIFLKPSLRSDIKLNEPLCND